MSLLSICKMAVLSPWYAIKSRTMGDNRSVVLIIYDILSLFRTYGVGGALYLKEKVGLMSSVERDSFLASCEERIRYRKMYNSNWAFLAEYADFKYQVSSKKREQRKKAYIERFHMGEHCIIQYGVKFIFEHHIIGPLALGDYIVFARDVDLDSTGGLTIEDNVNLSEGTKILTHNHPVNLFDDNDITHGAICTPLIIHDRASLGARVVIMPGVEEIGRGAMISAGSVVKRKVPPYAIVMGNPARVVGFRYTPDQILEFEADNYPKEKRLSEDVLRSNYKIHFIDRISIIQETLKQ